MSSYPSSSYVSQNTWQTSSPYVSGQTNDYLANNASHGFNGSNRIGQTNPTMNFSPEIYSSIYNEFSGSGHVKYGRTF